MKKIALFCVCAFLALFSLSASARPYDPVWIGNKYVFKWTGSELLLMRLVNASSYQDVVEDDGNIIQEEMPILPDVTVFSSQAWDVDEEYEIGEFTSGTRPAQLILCRDGRYQEKNQILSISYLSENDQTAVKYITFDLTIEKGKMTLEIKESIYRNGKQDIENSLLQRVYLTR